MARSHHVCPRTRISLDASMGDTYSHVEQSLQQLCTWSSATSRERGYQLGVVKKSIGAVESKLSVAKTQIEAKVDDVKAKIDATVVA